jgi:uncharacterized protein
VPFIGWWLDAPEPLLIERTAQRRNDPSDADAAVVRMQRNQDMGDLSWHRINASVPLESVISAANDAIRGRLDNLATTRR